MDYAPDTFSIGLCMLHMFTGSASYEEVMEEIECPALLISELKALWTVRGNTTHRNSRYLM